MMGGGNLNKNQIGKVRVRRVIRLVKISYDKRI